MLLTRHCEPEHSLWSFTKFPTAPQKPTSSRMSDQFDAPLSTVPEWQSEYSYSHLEENTVFPPSFQSDGLAAPARPESFQLQPSRVDTGHVAVKVDRHYSPLGHGPISEPPASRQIGLHLPGAKAQKQHLDHSDEGVHHVPAQNPDPTTVHMSSLRASAGTTDYSGGLVSSYSSANRSTAEVFSEVKDEDDEDGEDGEDDKMEESLGTAPSGQSVFVDRTLQRRKMKRFRLTHQQTRFLMSEFAKQPHPDTSHRERLSREIPGLSPRQVQVWFQNRRAKIKLLNAEDRDRMMQMRIVPENFDNVQALHSPYGAVHHLGTPVTPSVDFSNSPYADQMIHQLIPPLMVDVQIPESENLLSQTGVSPAFGSIGLHSSTSLGTPDILSPCSPMSPNGSDRYPYRNQYSTAIGSTNRPTQSLNSFMERQSSGLDSLQVHGQSAIRTMQSLHHNRSRPDNLHSPLRTSMSWKGDSIDYTSYGPADGTNPQLGNLPQPVFHNDPLGTQQLESPQSNTTTLGGFESASYSPVGTSIHAPSGINPSGLDYSTLQPQDPRNTSRLTTASGTLPLHLDTHNQYHSAATALQSPLASGSTRGLAVGTTTPIATTPHYGPVAVGTPHGLMTTNTTSYPSGFPSAPLTNTMSYSRTLGAQPGTLANAGSASSGNSPSVQEYPLPTLSASSTDFAQAYQTHMASPPLARAPAACDSFAVTSSKPGFAPSHARSHSSLGLPSASGCGLRVAVPHGRLGQGSKLVFAAGPQESRKNGMPSQEEAVAGVQSEAKFVIPDEQGGTPATGSSTTLRSRAYGKNP